jgi:hypothetical protein
MHRQHPYAGYTAQAGGRGIDSPPGPGPDRTRQAMSTRGYPASRARGMGRGGGGPSAYNGYESPYPGPALDNPYGEEGFNHYRENGGEYNQFENASGTLLALSRQVILFYLPGRQLRRHFSLRKREKKYEKLLVSACRETYRAN